MWIISKSMWTLVLPITTGVKGAFISTLIPSLTTPPPYKLLSSPLAPFESATVAAFT